MAAQERDELEAEIRRQRYRVDGLTEQLESLRIAVTAWPAAFLLIAALAVPLFGASSEDSGSNSSESIGLTTLVSRAGDVDNGAVQKAAIVLAILLAVAAVACVVIAIARDPRAALVAMVLAIAVIVLWLILLLAVGSSGDGGAIDDLGYENTLRVLLVPVAAAVAIAAGRVARDA